MQCRASISRSPPSSSGQSGEQSARRQYIHTTERVAFYGGKTSAVHVLVLYGRCPDNNIPFVKFHGFRNEAIRIGKYRFGSAEGEGKGEGVLT